MSNLNSGLAGSIHIYGKCGPLKCGYGRYILSTSQNDTPSVTESRCFDLVNRRYAFLIALENSLCAGYATEKVFNALLQVRKLNFVCSMLKNLLVEHNSIGVTR